MATSKLSKLTTTSSEKTSRDYQSSLSETKIPGKPTSIVQSSKLKAHSDINMKLGHTTSLSTTQKDGGKIHSTSSLSKELNSSRAEEISRKHTTLGKSESGHPTIQGRTSYSPGISRLRECGTGPKTLPAIQPKLIHQTKIPSTKPKSSYQTSPNKSQIPSKTSQDKVVSQRTSHVHTSISSKKSSENHTTRTSSPLRTKIPTMKN